MYLNNKEEQILSKFLDNLELHEKERMILLWNDGSAVIAEFDTCFEDENDFEMDDEQYEEFWSFCFKAIAIKGEPPVFITEDEFFLVSYHNFPDEIIVNGINIR